MQVRLRVRLFVVAFLAVFLVCGFAGYELWPFTGWKLFSHVRTERVLSWRVTVVDRDGAEEPVPFAHLPAAYGKWLHLAVRLPAMTDADRRGVCRAWASAVRPLDEVTEFRVYRGEESLLHPGADHPELWFVCAL